MNSDEFRIEVRTSNGRAVIDLNGEVNAAAGQALNDAYTQATADDGDQVVLNFGGVSYINSTGIAIIVELLGRARQAHRELVVYGLSDHYLEIFRITRLADFMTIREGENDIP